MKKIALVVVVGLLVSNFLVSHLAFAVSKKAEAPTSEVAAVQSKGDSSKRTGLGFASLSGLTGTSAALTGLLQFDRKNWLQPIAFLDSTSPVIFGVGALYKHVMASKGNAGFHLGGGFTMGSIPAAKGGTTLGGAVTGLGGIHVEFPGAEQILMQMDGGPVLSFGNQTNFMLNPLSGAFGFSVVYLF